MWPDRGEATPYDMTWVGYEPAPHDAPKMGCGSVQAQGEYDVFQITLGPRAVGLYWYCFWLKRDAGDVGVGCHERQPVLTPDPEPWQLSVYEQGLSTCPWLEGGIIYHVFVDRFAKAGEIPPKPDALMRTDWGGTPTYAPNAQGIVENRDFFGGNLNGICEKLPYLQDLGVTCLYLSPIFEAHSNHKYDTGDYFKIDPMFGTLRDFQELCAQARARGMAVVLDGVFNHTGDDSRYFNRCGTYPEPGAYQAEPSPYDEWYDFAHHPEDYASWWGIKILPAIKKDSPSFRRFITGPDGVIAYWMAQGASGFRLDVADELSDAMLDGIREAVKGQNRENGCEGTRENDSTGNRESKREETHEDSPGEGLASNPAENQENQNEIGYRPGLVLGEVWEDASNKIAYGARRRYLLGRQLDSVMNYPLMHAILQYARGGKAATLAAALAALVDHYPACVLHNLMNCLGTHDSLRALTALGDVPMEALSKAQQAATRMTPQQLVTAKARLKLASLLQFTLPGVPSIYYGDEAGMEGGADPFCRRCYPWDAPDDELVAHYQNLAELRCNPVFQRGDYRLLQSQNGIFAFCREDAENCVTVICNAGVRAVEVCVEGARVTLPPLGWRVIHTKRK